MPDPDLSLLPYRRPPPARGVDPQRINWLWRLICELASVESVEVVAALHAQSVPVNLRRVQSWTVSDREASFFPITLAEMERNVRALIALRQSAATAQAHDVIDQPATDADDATADGAADDVPDSPLKW